MWVVVELRDGEEPKCFAARQVLRSPGWPYLIFCDTHTEAEELASQIRQEGFTVTVTGPVRAGATARKTRAH